MSFCDETSWLSIVVAVAITYTPIGIFCLKVARGQVAAILNFFICTLCCFTFVYLVKHHTISNPMVMSFGALLVFLWGIYMAYNLVLWTIVRCRLCCLGRQYILAPPNHVESVDGHQPLTTTADTAFVVRKPGHTLVNGQLVPDFKSIVIGGRKATNLGAVSLHKYVK